MKRLKSSDDIDSYGDKCVSKDWVKRDEDSSLSLHRSLSHRNMYHKSDNGKKGLSSSSSRHDRLEVDREHSRSIRKRPDYDVDNYERRNGYDRYRDGERGIISSSPRGGYGGDRIHRSESFSVPRREFPKGFRSDRDRSRRDGSVSSWRRFSGVKDVDECGSRSGFEYYRGNKVPVDRIRSPGVSLGEMGRSNSYHSGWTPDRPQVSRDVKSPPCSKIVKSPSRSKDSETEQSKSVVVKKSEELPIESGNNSEMEEGELEPDSDPIQVPLIFKHVAEDEPSDELKRNDKQFSRNKHVEDESLGDIGPLSEAKLHLNQVKVHEEKTDIGVSEATQNVVKCVDNMSCFPDTLNLETNNDEDANATAQVVEFTKDGPCARENSISRDRVWENSTSPDRVRENSTSPDRVRENNTSPDKVRENSTSPERVRENSTSRERVRENSISVEMVSDRAMQTHPCNNEQKNIGIDLDIKSENIYLPTQIGEGGDKFVTSSVVLSLLDDRVNPSLKDKGKSLALSPPIVTASTEYILCGEVENNSEGPSTRGFELFFADPIKKVNKAEESSYNKLKDEKITIEPLELSLSLPNVLLPINSQNVIHATSSRNTDQSPNSPTHTRSIQSFASSFRTSSDAFTPSVSFSGSQTFTHNPSCSLTNSLYDNCEQSVGSRPIFGPDQTTSKTWQGQFLSETETKENLVHQKILSNGNDHFHHSQTSQGILNGQVVRLQQHRFEEGCSKLPLALDRQFSLDKQLGVQLRHSTPSTDVRSPSQSIVSRGIGSDYYNDTNKVMRDKSAGSHKQDHKQDQKESFQVGGADSIEPIINMLVSDPIHISAMKFNDMTKQAASSLKELVCDVILNPGKRSKLLSFQKALERRLDITLETLLKSHRAQLEVLVALKTGIQDFLWLNYEISSSDLVEIFLNLRCRNLTCRNLLPVDECDCRICVQKNGFCSACMCLVCSKFDTASNTCSWVGCDVCLHWCHADCGLRESYIRNGHSVTRAQGTTEMQFHCLACQHPSEMFGFVKEVFQNFAKEWTVETLSKELEYVRKIFHASEDARGKRLREIATQMLKRLVARCDIREIQSCIMASFTNNDSFKGNRSPVVPEKVTLKKKQGERTSIIGGSSHETPLPKVVYSDKAPQLEKSASLLPSFDFERNDKHIAGSNMLRHVQKDPGFDELESTIRIKQAEANMFQTRSDDARREAEGLKHIANVKNEKIEEEYASRIRKLHLIEAEKIRRRKFEQLQTIEREHEEYFNMKTRMKSEIKDLLLKMEATKCNFTL